MNCTVLILLYNKKCSLSKTVNSISTVSNRCFHGSNLIIWNNGPERIELEIDPDFIREWNRVELIQSIDNIPLSHVYNKVIDSFPAARYVFLDDDSKLTEGYIAAVTSTHAAVAVPAIYAQGQFRSPTVGGIFHSGPYKATDKVIAIGSGISVHADIAQQLKSHYGDVFDSRFALYGVDTTFFLRLHRLGLSSSIEMIDGFEHSLSRLEDETQSMSHFRQVERAYDLGLTMRHYMPWPKAIYVFSRQLIKCMLGKMSLIQLKYIVNAYKNGCHPKIRRTNSLF